MVVSRLIDDTGFLKSDATQVKADKKRRESAMAKAGSAVSDGNDGRVFDVVIAGAGYVGLATAVAIRSARPSLSVAIVDAAPAGVWERDGRASAIAAAACRMLERLGAWQAIAPHAQPITDMIVTDSRTHDPVRPVFLTFGGDVGEGEPFAHMIENRVLNGSLRARAASLGIDLIEGVAVLGFEPGPASTIVHLADGLPVETRLLIAADGVKSRLRDMAGIRTVHWDYGQSGIVCTVAHERPHGGRAEEHFLPAGPFAILPLKGRRCSIVWTEESREALRIVALPDDAFHDELERRFGLKLGEIEVVGPRAAYPLGLSVARSFIAERLALVGDAAHVIHPIAGQGLNLGLRDVAALAEAVVDAARLGLDPGSPDVLDRYQRWRRFDTLSMGIATDGLNRLFSNRSDALRLVRDIGLGLVERLPVLKGFFIREAAGLTGEVPKLLRGEAL